MLFHWFIAVWNQRALTKNCGYNNYGMYDMALLEEIHLVAKDHLGNWVTKHPLERDGVSFVPNLQNIKNREYGLTKLLREASPQAVVIAADLDDAASAADANLPDLAPVILADGDMEDAVEVADASGRAVEHEMEKPEGVLHPEELELLMVQYGKAIQPGGPGTQTQKTLDGPGWIKLCKNYNYEVKRQRMAKPGLAAVLKYKTAHLLRLAHGRASEMLMAKHLLRGKVEKFKQFRAYLKDSSKFVFSLPEPRAWPDGKSVGNSDGESGGGDSGGSNSSGVVSRPKVPAIMGISFKVDEKTPKTVLERRLNILETRRHCLSCCRVVQQKKNKASDWVLTDTSGEHEDVISARGGVVPFPHCTVAPMNPEEKRARRKARKSKVWRERQRIKNLLRKLGSEH